MFIYVFTVSGEWTCDDIRVVEDRREALLFMKILGIRPRVLCRPI